jgi:hypothetical protein
MTSFHVRRWKPPGIGVRQELDGAEAVHEVLADVEFDDGDAVKEVPRGYDYGNWSVAGFCKEARAEFEFQTMPAEVVAL